MGRSRFLTAIRCGGHSCPTAYGSGTSIACRELDGPNGAWFPEAHLDAEKMAALAMAGHTVLGFDVVMPLFSVCHEAAAMGCNVNWGGPDAMPESGKPIFRDLDDIRIPADLLPRPGCAVPLRAISLLKKRLGDDAAVCGKVFGSWTQAYHYFGVEKFLMGAWTIPTRRGRSSTGSAGDDPICRGPDRGRRRLHSAGRPCHARSVRPADVRAVPRAAAPAIGRGDQGPGDPAHLRQHERPHRDDRPNRPGLFPLGHQDGQPGRGRAGWPGHGWR